MIRSSDKPDSRTMPSVERCSPSRRDRLSNSSMPSTPFSGVRISWLIVARKLLFARFAASAFSFACSSTCASRFCSVTSAQ